MDRFRQFMVGRYGSDKLNIALLVLYLILSVIFSFTGWSLILLAAYACVVLTFFRMLSKDTTKRWKENQKFLTWYNPIVGRLKGKRNGIRKNSAKAKSDKNHKVFQCGKCGQLIRVPRGKGKIAITCPNCKQEFIKRT